MSHEFYQIMVGAPTMSLYSWKQLARWSIDYSCLSKAEKAKGHEILVQDWKDFCEQVVHDYRDLMAGDELDETKVKEKKMYPERAETS
jgi:adenosine deaminase CECR1